MIASKTWYYNPKYVNDLVYTVTKGNATYNNMQVHWDVAQDLPEDLRVSSTYSFVIKMFKQKNLDN